IEKKSEEIENLHIMINTQSEVIGKKENEIMILEEKMSSLQVQYDEHVDSNISLSYKLEIERTEVDNLRTEVDNLRTEVDNLCTEVDNLRTEVDNLHTEVDNLRTEVDNLRTEVDNLHTEVDNLRTEVDNLRTEVDNLQNANNKQMTYIQTKDRNLRKLVDENLKLESDNFNLKKKNRMLELLIEKRKYDRDET
ncbi:6696_t:CDS:2, partial [Gigaspora margarita]